MAFLSLFLLLNFVVSAFSRSLFAEDRKDHVFQRDVIMPGAVSRRADALLCHSVKMDERPAYILEYEPHASKEIAHHMVLYGCPKPGNVKDWWECENDGDRERNICEDGTHQIIYAWALDAPAKKLPKDVGFRVGGTTDFQYVVVQIHYRNKFDDGVVDKTSGLTLHLTYDPQPLQAGYFILASYGLIPPHRKEFHVDIGCMYTGQHPIHAFAYRTHSHNLGVVTAGYRIRGRTWTEIGRMSPQQPQMFYNATNGGVDIRKGDVLAARCTMNSMERDAITPFGPRNQDEMCNFYIMYYTQEQTDLKVKLCTRNSLIFHLDDYFDNIPQSAGSLEGVKLTNPDNEHHRHHKKGQMRLV